MNDSDKHDYQVYHDVSKVQTDVCISYLVYGLRVRYKLTEAKQESDHTKDDQFIEYFENVRRPKLIWHVVEQVEEYGERHNHLNL